MSNPIVTAGSTTAAMKIVPYNAAYRDSLFGFLRRAFPAYPRKYEPAYFDWMFSRSPLGSSLDTYQLLIENDRVVGQIGTMRNRLYLGGAWVDSLSIVDLNIDPAHRGGLAARQLFKRAMASARLVFATGVAAHVVPIYDGLGWKRLTFTQSRYSVLRPSRLLALARTTEGAPAVSAPLRGVLGIADVVVPLARRAASIALGHRSTARVEEVAQFDPASDRQLLSLTERYAITEFRSAALLNWKFVDRPIGRHRILTLRSSARDLNGMLVLKQMERAGVARWIEVADYLVAPDDAAAFRSLMDACLAIAAQERVDFVRMRLSHADHVSHLRRPAWFDYTRPFNDDVFVYSREPELLASAERGPWHLTALASDRSETGRDE